MQMGNVFEEQACVSGLKAGVAHSGEDGLLLLPCFPQCFQQVTLLALVALVSLQWFCKPLSNLHEVDLSFISVLVKGFILF